MITTTLGHVVGALEPFHRLASLSLPMSASCHLARGLKALADEAQIFYSRRTELLKRLGEVRDPTEDEKRLGLAAPFVSPEHREEFKRLLQELLAVPSILNWEPFNLQVVHEENIRRMERKELPLTLSGADLNLLGLDTEEALVVEMTGVKGELNAT